MNSVWVLVNIYQNDIAYVHLGEDVIIDNETYPGVVRGKIQYVAPALDPTTRTLQARIEASNPGERLKKDMYVTAEVRAGVIPNALPFPMRRCCATPKTCRTFTCKPAATSSRGAW